MLWKRFEIKSHQRRAHYLKPGRNGRPIPTGGAPPPHTHWLGLKNVKFGIIDSLKTRSSPFDTSLKEIENMCRSLQKNVNIGVQLEFLWQLSFSHHMYNLNFYCNYSFHHNSLCLVCLIYKNQPLKITTMV